MARIAMNLPVEQWGRRLGDTLRAAVRAGDFEQARRLAAEGDGQARSLAGEFAFMVRGLGITVRVLLDLFPGAAAELEGDPAQRARDAAGVVIARFAQDILALTSGGATGAQTDDDRLATPGGARDLGAAIAAARQALERCEAWFQHDQAAIAQDCVDAIDGEDRDAALALLDRKETGGYLPLHDRLIRFMADSFDWALRHVGPDGLVRLHLRLAEAQREGFEKWERMPAEQFAWTTAFLLKQHMGNVSVSEDAMRFTVEQTPCGSGGRLRLLGAYDGPAALSFVETPGPLTFGRARLPVYCSHCAIWNGAATLRWFGRVQWVFDDPARADGGCRMHIYRRPEDTPPELVRRVGLGVPET